MCFIVSAGDIDSKRLISDKDKSFAFKEAMIDLLVGWLIALRNLSTSSSENSEGFVSFELCMANLALVPIKIYTLLLSLQIPKCQFQECYE
jgi:hypothetical protein